MPTPVPAWFPEFAEAVAGIKLGERGNVELVPGANLRKATPEWPFTPSFSASGGEGVGEGPMTGGTVDPYQRVADWLLADPAQRPAAPF
jgi:hypothetical protein